VLVEEAEMMALKSQQHKTKNNNNNNNNNKNNKTNKPANKRF